MLRGKKVFISGGAGVIGNELVKILYEFGARIFVGDLKPRPKDWPEDILYRQGDLNHIKKPELIEFSPEYFFHLAATFERSIETREFWEENFHHNVKLSHHLISCLKDADFLKKIIFASSYLIYDPELYNFPVPSKTAIRLLETDSPSPRNLCGGAKLFHEAELQFLDNLDYGFEIVCARIFRVYGRRSRDVISRWIRSLLAGTPLNVFKEDGLFDFIYAPDVAEGLIRLAASDATGIVNLGTDEARRIREVVEILKSHFPDMETVPTDSEIPFEASQANMDLFQKLTGWSPPARIEDGIPEIITFEKECESMENDRSRQASVLVTSISSKVPLLKSLRQGINKLGTNWRIIGADTNPNCIGRYFVDSFWHIPKLSEITAREIIDYGLAENVAAIIPTRDGELPFFSGHKSMFAEKSMCVMVPSLETVKTCLDKYAFYQILRSYSFPGIETVPNIEELNVPYYVVKERFGAGSRHIGLKLTKEQAIAHAKTLENPVFQPYVDGNEVSIDVYVDAKGKSKGAIVRAREVVVGGESQVTVTKNDPELERLCSRLAERLQLYGHAVFQVIIDINGNYHFVECNCRFGGASTLSLDAGLDSFYWFLLESTGQSIAEYKFIRSSTEKRQVRFPQDVVFDENAAVSNDPSAL